MSESLQVQIHPLVVLNVSDHFTRARYRVTNRDAYRTIGLLFGRQEGRLLEIENSLELTFSQKSQTDVSDI